MQESEFRDWARRAQGSFDERLKVLEGKVGAIEAAAAAPRVGGKMAGGQVEMVEGLLKVVRGGGVRALGFVYLGLDGMNEGWSCSGGADAHHALLGGVMSLADDLLHPDKNLVTGAASGETGQTDEGNPGRPEAREVAASAPAGGV